MQYDLNEEVPMVPGASAEALGCDSSRREVAPLPGDEDAPKSGGESFATLLQAEDRWVELYLMPEWSPVQVSEAFQLQNWLAMRGRLQAASDRAVGQRVRLSRPLAAEAPKPDNDGADYKPVTLEAHGLVFGDRGADYGHPLDDFSRSAHYWTGHLRDRLKPGCEVAAEDVGPMMCLFKLSRQANKAKRDNMTDTAGYAETTERVIHERARRERIAAKEKTDASSV